MYFVPYLIINIIINNKTTSNDNVLSIIYNQSIINLQKVAPLIKKIKIKK